MARYYYASLRVSYKKPRATKKASKRRENQLARLALSTLTTTTNLSSPSKSSSPATTSTIARADDSLNHLDVELRADDFLNRLDIELRENAADSLTPISIETVDAPTSPTTDHAIINFPTPLSISLNSSLPSSPSPLLNPIHPLFSPSNFPTLSPTHHALLAPALRLASRLLTSPLTFAWWLKPLLSPHTLPHPSIPNATILSAVPDTFENRVAAYLRLRRHARTVRIRFRAEKGAFASTHRAAGAGEAATVVFLDTRFERFLPSSSSADFPRSNSSDDDTRAQQLRFFFLLAVNLVHEVAHTLCEQQPEPFHSEGDCANELGSSWEAHAFSGGKIQAVGFDVECRHGLMWYPHLSAEEERRWIADGRGRFWGVEMGWVESMFREEYWGLAELGGKREMLGVRVCGEGSREPFLHMG